MEVSNEDDQVDFNSTNPSIISPVTKRKKLSLECKVCGDSATYVHFGVMTCDSCKVFFRRNAENHLKRFQCSFDKNCSINILNRHVCTSCRLKKCFQVGMSTVSFRGSYPKKRIIHKTQLIQPSTSNLLRSDQSTLNHEEWNLLSNVIQCYDEHNTILVSERFIREQNSLPIKLRFKIEAVGQMLLLLISQNQSCFHSLTSHDQSVLINSSLKHVVSLSTVFTSSHSRLLDEVACLKLVENVFETHILDKTRQLINHLDCDDILMKLTLPIVLFSTTNYLLIENPVTLNLIDPKLLLTIQNTYVDLAWKYLMNKYDYYQTVKSFNNMTRVILICNEIIHQSQKTKVYIDTIQLMTK